jgi:LysM repeat protein
MKRFLSTLIILATLTVLLAVPQPTQAHNNFCFQFYVVQPGDNLFRIALRFGQSFTQLQIINGIADPNRIYVGQVLCVRASNSFFGGGFFGNRMGFPRGMGLQPRSSGIMPRVPGY